MQLSSTNDDDTTDPSTRPAVLKNVVDRSLHSPSNCCTWETTDRGVQFTTPEGLVRLDVVSDEIIRVSSTPLKEWPDKYSIMTAGSVTDAPASCRTSLTQSSFSLHTSSLEVRFDLETASLSFLSPQGEMLVSELPQGRQFTAANVLGEETYHVQQRFDASHIKAIHGLGGHQNNISNYKGKDVLLQQYNIVDVNPFFVTDQSWGILWDNNSITSFGDPRPYQDLSALLQSGIDKSPHGLTATYFKNADFTSPLLSRHENVQNYQYISDIPGNAPEGFSFIDGSIRWEGYFEPKTAGIHKFQLYGSSYTKIWVDGELVVDRWRQNWMPWTNEFTLDLKPHKSVHLKIDWVCHDGYHSFKCLSPAPREIENQIILTSEVGEMIDYYFVRGANPSGVVANYRHLTGQATIPPRWAFGYWQSRERYQTQDELLETVRTFRELGFPIDNIVQDWFYWPEAKWGDHDFESERFPDPSGMLSELHQKLNTHYMISVWPKFYLETRNFDLMSEKGWLYQRNVELGELDWVGDGYRSTFYDAFNEEAGQCFWNSINEKLFSKGVDAWWLDATEADIHSNTSVLERQLRMNPTAKGSGASQFNAFSIHNAKAVYEGQRQQAPDQRAFILTRSAFAGIQRYGTAVWSGDIASRWEDFSSQISSGINFAAAGIPYWTTDIGGFAVESRFENPSEADLEEWRELQLRWFQFGAFCPLFRSHGQYPLREPFNIAPTDHPVYKSMLRYTKLRYSLMPYIYSLGASVTHQGASIMRPLLFDFPDQPELAAIDDQFLFGPNLLVAPVTKFGATSRLVTLPAGVDWYHLQTNQRFTGGQTLSVDTPLEDLALFVKAGSLLVFGPDIQYVKEKQNHSLEIRVYPGADGEFTLYEDDGLSYQYEKGKHASIRISWVDTVRNLTIATREGSFDEMLSERVFHIVNACSLKGDAFERSSLADATIHYSGKSVQVAL